MQLRISFDCIFSFSLKESEKIAVLQGFKHQLCRVLILLNIRENKMLMFLPDDTKRMCHSFHRKKESLFPDRRIRYCY